MKSLNVDCGFEETNGVSFIKISVLHIWMSPEISLTIENADAIVENVTKRTPFTKHRLQHC